MAKIHPHALVDPKAKLGPGVEIGAYAIIGDGVEIGRDTRVHAHAIVQGHTRIGERCEIFSHACLGTPPQVRTPPAASYLEVGDDNIIRESVTMNPGMSEGSRTRIGNKNFIMIGAHVAHDCLLGDQITIANGVGLAGYVTVEDHATIGGLCGIHQHVRVGKYAMIGGVSKAVADIPPYSTCDGHPAVFCGINALGLKRARFTPAQRLAIGKALKMLLASGKKMSTAMEEVEREFSGDPHVCHLLEFMKGSKRGVVRAPSGWVEEAVH